LNENTNVALLSQEIVDKCKLIHQSKISLVESIVQSLKERKIQDDKSNSLMFTSKKSETHSKHAPVDDWV
jgi:hypothetical protein